MNRFNNRQIKSRPAQWLRASAGDIPPVAFAIPQEEFLRVLHGFPSANEATIRKLVQSQLTARYGSVVSRLEAERENAAECVEHLARQRHTLATQTGKLPQLIPESEPTAKMPSGLKRIYVIALVVAALGVLIFDWMTAAGFAARAETHDFVNALLFTGLIPAATLALEALLRRLKLPEWSVSVSLLFLILTSLSVFLWRFVTVYVSPDQSLNQVLEALSDPATTPIDKRPLLFAQLYTGILLGALFVSEVRAMLVRRHCDVVNPNWVTADKQLSHIQARLHDARKKLAEPMGDLNAWNSSIQVHVDKGLQQVAFLRRRDEMEKALRSNLAEGVAHLNRQLSSSDHPNNSSNGR